LDSRPDFLFGGKDSLYMWKVLLEKPNKFQMWFQK